MDDNSVFEALESELSEAISNLVIEEGEDDQAKLREMIIGLQVSALNRGITMNPGEVKPDVSARTAISGEEATSLVASLLRDGVATISLVVVD